MPSYAQYYGITLPAESDVRIGVSYGFASTEFEGALVVGGIVDTGVHRDRYRYDWNWCEDIADAAYRYSDDRNINGLPSAPASGVKVRVLEPDQNQIAVAASTVGYDSSDRVIEVWSDTLRGSPSNPDSPLIRPMPGDFFTVDGLTYFIRSAKSAVWGWRWVCMCKESAFTERP